MAESPIHDTVMPPSLFLADRSPEYRPGGDIPQALSQALNMGLELMHSKAVFSGVYRIQLSYWQPTWINVPDKN